METAYVLLNCDLGSEPTIIEDLKHIDSVSEVSGVYGAYDIGAYDIIVKVKNSEREKLRDIIIWKIRKLEHVRSTLTLMGIQGQK